MGKKNDSTQAIPEIGRKRIVGNSLVRSSTLKQRMIGKALNPAGGEKGVGSEEKKRPRNVSRIKQRPSFQKKRKGVGKILEYCYFRGGARKRDEEIKSRCYWSEAYADLTWEVGGESGGIIKEQGGNLMKR